MKIGNYVIYLYYDACVHDNWILILMYFYWYDIGFCGNYSQGSFLSFRKGLQVQFGVMVKPATTVP